MREPELMKNLISQFSRLPGVGEKTATRFVYFVLRQPESYSQQFSSALLESKKHIQMCAVCCTFSQEPVCSLCSDADRNPNQICVVEKPSDIFCLEKMHVFSGRYHVLHGLLRPLEGVTEESLTIGLLLDRLKKSNEPKTELIFAFNSTMEGNTTAFYLSRKLSSPAFFVKKSRLLLPLASRLDYLESSVLKTAFSHREQL
jgi:recombination protein RecR